MFLFRKKKKKEKAAKIIRLDDTTSTNDYLMHYNPQETDDSQAGGKDKCPEGEEIIVAVSGYQSAGRGQGGNTWESEPGKNLLFSLLVHPTFVPVREQFILSMAIALTMRDVLAEYIPDVSIKWPNDIYYKDKKICGILIENHLSAHGIKDCVMGVGLDVNQREFHSDAPNPVSLYQILGRETPLDELLDKIVKKFQEYYKAIEFNSYEEIIALYMSYLYRSHGFYPYEDKDGRFEAAIVEVESDGHLVLRDREGMIRRYAFKEVRAII